MILQVFSVYDVVARNYNLPFYVQNREVAIRAFVASSLDPQTVVYHNPKDFQLFHVGSYDDDTGQHQQRLPENLGNAFTLQSEANQPRKE